MKAKLLSIALLVLLAPRLCLALMGLDMITAERAKEMGIEIRATPAGPDAVRVELEFATEGGLKGFHRAELNVQDGGKSLLSTSLKEDRSKPGRIIVSFAADRASLGKFSLWLVAGDIGNYTAYVLRLTDFVRP